MGTTTTKMALAVALLGFAGCKKDAEAAADTDAACEGAKCDDPSDSGTGTGGTTGSAADTDRDSDTDTDGCSVFDVEPEDVFAECADRAEEAFNPNRASFQREALRWSCLDVPGRLPTERGQEYCEYFAIVQVPDEAGQLGDPEILGMNRGPTFEEGQTPFSLELSDYDIAALEAAPDQVVGSCVFTSWDADIDAPMRKETHWVQDVPIDADVFRMKHEANTNEAAQLLIQDCSLCIATGGDPGDPDDPLHDDFTRGCFLNAEINGTEDRKSDSVICSAAMRLGECACFSPSAALIEALAPTSELGFPLGTWDDPQGLPSGCRYQDFGPSGRNIVSCDLTAAELLQNAAEVKAYCADKYADDVVVHIEVPANDLFCVPLDSEQYGHTCTEEPWVLQ